MKKAIVSIATLAALTVALSAGAFAKSSSIQHYNTCTVKTCTATSNHKHNGKTYEAHKSGDAHAYHIGSHKSETNKHR